MSPHMDEPPSSPPSAEADPAAAIAYYKAQYEMLESELADFRESSHELEAELEKDLVAMEKRERQLEKKCEELGDKSKEWQKKYVEAKNESGTVQAQLQKEITTLREQNRVLSHKLRDIEVTNDDFERQARHTNSSLEDLENKYNVAIERAVMMEEEIRIGEQERETLRIETQRLRDDLSDLKIEAEVLQEKLKRAESRQLPMRTGNIIGTGTIYPKTNTAPSSPYAYLDSPASNVSSPFISTPDSSSLRRHASVAVTRSTPPSPPISDRSATTSNSTATAATAPVKSFKTPQPRSKIRAPSADHSITPKSSSITPKLMNPRSTNNVKNSVTPKPSRMISEFRQSRGSWLPPPANKPSRQRESGVGAAPAPGARVRGAAAPNAQPERKMPNSNSLVHIRAITAQMQRLEQRVQSARSKLPAPSTTATTPTASSNVSLNGSPRAGSVAGDGNYLARSVTVRSRKRTTGSVVSTSTAHTKNSDETPSQSRHVSRMSSSTIGHGMGGGVSRLSFGPRDAVPPTPSLTSGHTGIGSHDDNSRPSSRASISQASVLSGGNGGFAKPERPASCVGERPSSRRGAERPSSRSTNERPPSRTSLGGARTPHSMYSQSSASELRRPRSSFGQHNSFASSIGPGYVSSHAPPHSLYGEVRAAGGGGGHGYSQSVSAIAVDFDDLDLNGTPTQPNRAPTPSGRRSSTSHTSQSSSNLGTIKSGLPMPGHRRTSHSTATNPDFSSSIGPGAGAGNRTSGTPQPRRMERKMSGAVSSSLLGLRNESRAGIAERKREKMMGSPGSTPGKPMGGGSPGALGRMGPPLPMPSISQGKLKSFGSLSNNQSPNSGIGETY